MSDQSNGTSAVAHSKPVMSIVGLSFGGQGENANGAPGAYVPTVDGVADVLADVDALLAMLEALVVDDVMAVGDDDEPEHAAAITSVAGARRARQADVIR